MEAFEVVSSIPVPTLRGRGRNPIYPFAKMNKGDSFLLPADANIRNVSAAASSHGKRHKMKFSIQHTSEGYRCWRVK